MTKIFYDTSALLENCSLLDKNKDAGGTNFISAIVLKELEEIKNSKTKDENLKYKARRILRKLKNHPDYYRCCIYDKNLDEVIQNIPTLCLNNDGRLIYQCAAMVEEFGDIQFATADLCCYKIAEAYGLNAVYSEDKKEPYDGYIHIYCNTEEELADVYEKIYSKDSSNYFNALLNQYVLIADKDKKVIDRYKWAGKEYVRVPDFYTFESKMFGKVKPQTPYQLIAMDALINNKIAMLHGRAGSGKSLLSLAYLYQELDRGNIDKVIVFCNTVAARGAAKLGYYPGDRTDKLLDSSIGNFLVGKFGGMEGVEYEIDKGRLLLLPLSDIRGFDTTGQKAGIYITEAQNLDIELMRLALQRIGEDCLCIIEGDYNAQVDLDLYAGNNNGMRRVSEVFRGSNIYGEVRLPQVLRSEIAILADKL